MRTYKKYVFPNIIAEMVRNGDDIKSLANKMGIKKPYTLSMKLQGKSQFDLAEIHFLITLYGKNFDELFYDKRLEQQTA